MSPEDELLHQESLVSSAMLRGARNNECPDEDFMHDTQDIQRRRIEFRQTVFALKAIITKKLYKQSKGGPGMASKVKVADYFKSRWDVSRAQAYRYVDCAPILTVSFDLRNGEFPR